MAGGDTAAVISTFPFSTFFCVESVRRSSPKEMGGIATGKWRLRNTPVCQRRISFFLTSYRLWMHQWDKWKDKICLSKHVLSKKKKIPPEVCWKYKLSSKDDRKRTTSRVEKRKESDNFVLVWVAKIRFKQATGTEHRHSSSLLLPHPLYFFNFFLCRLRNIRFGPWDEKSVGENEGGVAVSWWRRGESEGWGEERELGLVLIPAS